MKKRIFQAVKSEALNIGASIAIGAVMIPFSFVLAAALFCVAILQPSLIVSEILTVKTLAIFNAETWIMGAVMVRFSIFMGQLNLRDGGRLW